MIKNKIYVLGSINIDLVITTSRIPNKGETLLGSGFLINAGGKGANQAVAAAKLGADVKMIGAVGNDQFKSVALESIKSANVDATNVSTKENSTTGVAIIIRAENDNRIILDSGSNKKITKEELINGLKTALESDVFISQFEVNEDIVLEGLRMAKEKRMITILNPAPAKIINEEMYQYIDYLVVNQTESELLTSIYPTDLESSIEVSKYFKSKGIENVIITLGEKGSAFISEQAYFAKSHKISPVDTTGAGDSFIGALGFGLVNGLDNEEILKLCNATSALVCLKEGAQQSMPKIDEVIEFIKEEK